jgi:hypothetical protein
LTFGAIVFEGIAFLFEPWRLIIIALFTKVMDSALMGRAGSVSARVADERSRRVYLCSLRSEMRTVWEHGLTLGVRCNFALVQRGIYLEYLGVACVIVLCCAFVTTSIAALAHLTHSSLLAEPVGDV